MFKNFFQANKKDITNLLVDPQAIQNVDTFIFGDSVFLRTSDEDVNKTTIKSFAEAIDLPAEKIVKVLAYSGISIPHFCLYILRHKSNFMSYRNILIPVNIRSFSLQWEMNPAWQYPEVIRDLLKATSLNHLDVKDFFRSEIDYKNASAKYYYYGERNNKFFLENEDHVSNLTSLIEKRKKFMAFCYLWDAEILNFSKKFSALDKLIESIGTLASRLTFIILPINYQGIDFLFEQDGLNFYLNNKNEIITQLSSRGLKVVDCSSLVDRFGFFNPLECNEHLNLKGRVALGNNLKSIILN